MNHALKREFLQYTQTVLGFDPDIREFERVGSLPHYLRERYEFNGLNLGGKDLLLFSSRRAGWDGSPNRIRQDAERIREITQKMPVWVAREMQPYFRRSLIGTKQAFIVPGRQAYLPSVFLDLREKFGPLSPRLAGQPLSATAQAIVLKAIYEREPEITGATQQAEFAVSKMTLSRAVRELEDAEILKSEFHGRTKWSTFNRSGSELWKKALPLLFSPVRSRCYLSSLPPQLRGLPDAGLTALAEISSISAPNRIVKAASPLAIHGAAAKEALPISTYADEAVAEIEFWSYPPLRAEGDGQRVDPLSLYLSLRDDPDERVQAALSEAVAPVLADAQGT